MTCRFHVALLGLLASLLFPVLTLWPGTASANSCKAAGQQCYTNVSCCSGCCKKPTRQRGASTFGTCCAPTTCSAEGKNCGTIPDGCCGTLDCGTCTAPESCGGGGTTNVCGCTPMTCAELAPSCGLLDDGCGSSIDCGCTPPESCGGGGTPNVCGLAVCGDGVMSGDEVCDPPGSVESCNGEGGGCIIVLCEDGCKERGLRSCLDGNCTDCAAHFGVTCP